MWCTLPSSKNQSSTYKAHVSRSKVRKHHNMGDTQFSMASVLMHTAAELCAPVTCDHAPDGRSLVGREVPMVRCWPRMSVCLLCCCARALALPCHSFALGAGAVGGAIVVGLLLWGGHGIARGLF